MSTKASRELGSMLIGFCLEKIQMATASACAERATSETLTGPDWAINIELCDIINMYPGQTKDALKILKKRLGSRHAKKQLLALFALETLSKNCGDNIFQLIAERDVLHEMVKIVKKKPDLNVREKVLYLIDTWQEVLGGRGGRYPQYYAAFQELRAAGIEFPPREENVVPLFTPAQTQATVHPPSVYEDPAIEASLQSNVSTLSAKEIENAQGLADVLDDMLGALDLQNREGVNQEVIVDLVDQCHSYQSRVRILVNSTIDEGLLFQGLELNDKLQRVLLRHENMVKGTGTPTERVEKITEPSVVPVMNVNHEDEESDDDFAPLAHRSSRETLRASPFLRPPPPSDYLSGDDYNSEYNQKLSSPPYTKNNATSPTFSCPPVYDEPSPKSSQSPISLPPPPAKYNQRQQFFEKQQHAVTGGPSHSRNGSGSDSSYDSLMAQTQNLSLSLTPANKEAKTEDALFKDLVDFAKSKSTTSKSNRSY